MTQADRILAHLQGNPGSSSWELTLATGTINTTGRISDLRQRGHVIECRKGSDGVDRYWLVVPQKQLAMSL